MYVQIVTVAATQMSCGNPEENIKKAESLVRIASSRGAQVILLQELFQFSYFPIELNAANFQLATSLEESALVQGMALLAKELRVVIPISFFERYRNSFYNSVAVIDADGAVLGVVRKQHIGGTSLRYCAIYQRAAVTSGYSIGTTTLTLACAAVVVIVCRPPWIQREVLLHALG